MTKPKPTPAQEIAKQKAAAKDRWTRASRARNEALRRLRARHEEEYQEIYQEVAKEYGVTSRRKQS